MAIAANSTTSFAGYLDGEMDSKGICFSALVGTECQRSSGLVLGALLKARERTPSRLPLLPVLPYWLLLQTSTHQSFSFKSLLLRRTY